MPTVFKSNYLLSQYHTAFIALAVYFIFWLIAPIFLAQSVALDVSEGVNWGHEWRLGYYKHPPLSSWVLYSVYALAGDIGVNFLSELCMFSGAYFAYRLGCVMFSKQQAVIGGLLLFFISYYSYPSLEFNHNVAQLPLWTGMAWAFYLAISTKPSSKNWGYWLIVGLLGGVGMLTKYHMAFLLVTMALYLCLPTQRHWLKSPQAWVACLLMVGLFAPHVYWLTQNNWLPFDYLHSRIESDSLWAGHLSWLEFMGLQLLSVLAFIGAVKTAFNLPIVASVRLGLANFWQNLTANTFKRATFDSAAADYFYLQFMLIVPLLLVCLCSVLGGMMLVNLWAMPMWGLLGLVVVAKRPTGILTTGTPRLLSLLAKWLLFATVFKVLMMVVMVRFDEKPSHINFPQQAISEQVATTWQQLSHCPMDSLSGDRWITAIAAMRQPSLSGTFPSLMIAGSPAFSPWMSQERLRQHGTLVLWKSDTPVDVPLLSFYNAQPLKQPFADADFVMYQGQWSFSWRDIPHKAPLKIQWVAYVPKACSNPVVLE